MFGCVNVAVPSLLQIIFILNLPFSWQTREVTPMSCFPAKKVYQILVSET
jgi:hypothetical protein